MLNLKQASDPKAALDVDDLSSVEWSTMAFNRGQDYSTFIPNDASLVTGGQGDIELAPIITRTKSLCKQSRCSS